MDGKSCGLTKMSNECTGEWCSVFEICSPRHGNRHHHEMLSPWMDQLLHQAPLHVLSLKFGFKGSSDVHMQYLSLSVTEYQQCSGVTGSLKVEANWGSLLVLAQSPQNASFQRVVACVELPLSGPALRPATLATSADRLSYSLRN